MAKEFAFTTFPAFFQTMNHFGVTDPENIKGVHIMFVHRYAENGPTEKLRLRNCIFLGHERFGNYQRTFNFFGGKVEKSTLIETVYNELFEEFGGKPNVNFWSSVIKAIRINSSLLLVCHITGISASRVKSKMLMRINCGKYKSCFCEMDDAIHMPFDSINRKNDTISSYVQSIERYLPEITDLISKTRGVPVKIAFDF
jgi:hypothetical protein